MASTENAPPLDSGVYDELLALALSLEGTGLDEQAAAQLLLQEAEEARAAMPVSKERVQVALQ